MSQIYGPKAVESGLSQAKGNISFLEGSGGSETQTTAAISTINPRWIKWGNFSKLGIEKAPPKDIVWWTGYNAEDPSRGFECRCAKAILWRTPELIASEYPDNFPPTSRLISAAQATSYSYIRLFGALVFLRSYVPVRPRGTPRPAAWA